MTKTDLERGKVILWVFSTISFPMIGFGPGGMKTKVGFLNFSITINRNWKKEQPIWIWGTSALPLGCCIFSICHIWKIAKSSTDCTHWIWGIVILEVRRWACTVVQIYGIIYAELTRVGFLIKISVTIIVIKICFQAIFDVLHCFRVFFVS